MYGSNFAQRHISYKHPNLNVSIEKTRLQIYLLTSFLQLINWCYFQYYIPSMLPLRYNY